MSRRSLRFRLHSAAAITVVVALGVAAMGLVTLFERHAERRLDAELETDLRQLIGRLELGPDGRIRVTSDLADPRFEEPLSGLYWQVRDETRPTLLRSRSLWDATIPLAPDVLTLGVVHRHHLPGPGDQRLLVRERQVILRPDNEARRLRVAVAVDRAELDAAGAAFAADILPYLALLAAVLVAATWVQVRTGLAPLDLLRRRVLAVRSGAAQRLDDRFPDEVMPLVEAINELLQARDAAVERARAWTADLAHGLKTPLTALGADARRLRAAGHGEMAADLERLAEAMGQRVDRELIRARLRSAAPETRAHADVVPAVRRVLVTLQRTPAGEAVAWDLALPETAPARIPCDDLSELLGNLLENAAKWAAGRVRVTVAPGPPVELAVADDGPGVPKGELSRLGQRGLRLDEQTPGTGLGLAIVGDIVTAYGGELDFFPADLGGLGVRVRLPAATSPEAP